MSDLKIDVQNTPGLATVLLIGPADMIAADEMNRRFMMVSLQKPAVVVVDMSGLTFLSSICMGSLVRFKKDIERSGGKLTLAKPTEPVLTALKRALLDRLFEITL